MNGLTSERRTFTTGTGGPEGDHISTIADDFILTGGPWNITDMRACMFQNTSTEAEAWIYNSTGTAPVLPVTDVRVGHSTAGGQDLQSIVFVDNGTRCRTAFGYPGREFSFSPTSTGVTFSLPAGEYWLAVVGGPAAGGTVNGRAFRARSTTSSPRRAAATPRMPSGAARSSAARPTGPARTPRASATSRSTSTASSAAAVWFVRLTRTGSWATRCTCRS
ncbi:MAG: hypothetical protein IPL60_17210 [Ardenticatenia bacterium]|nr:hypothetical protein [Ardenticatenia bacterium]